MFLNVFFNKCFYHSSSLNFFGDTSVTLPPRPPRYINFFKPFLFFTAGDQLVVPIGASHISLPLQEIQSREREKNEQTNNMLGLTQMQKGSYVTLCICRLTLVWILAKLLQSYWNADSSLLVFPHCFGSHLMSTGLSVPVSTGLSAPVWTGHSRHLSPTPTSQSLCPTLRLAFPSYFRSRRDFKSKPFVWFRAKTDKRIVCLADHLYSVTCLRKTKIPCFDLYKSNSSPTLNTTFRQKTTYNQNDQLKSQTILLLVSFDSSSDSQFFQWICPILSSLSFYYKHSYLLLLDFFIPALSDDFSLEHKWQQVSSAFQETSICSS